MKLKYLLPAATIASVATIVTPLVTSCSKKQTATYTWKEGGGNYKPMKPKKAHDFGEQTTLGVTYRKDISKNHFIWADDMVNFLGSESDKDHDRYNIEKLSYTLTKVTASDDLFGEYATFRISFKMTITGKIKNSGITLEFNNRKAVATNIPVYVRYSSSQVDIWLWDELIPTDDKWQMNMPEVVEGSGGQPEIGTNNKTYDKDHMPGSASTKMVFTTLMKQMTSIDDSNYYSKQSVN